MRRHAKIDANQPDIVKSLRQAGCSVLSLAPMGKGCVDLLVGKGGKNFMLEVKDPSQKPSQRKLTDDERAFHAAWLGQIAIVETAEEALKIALERA
jgi:Holliday junction resolvase